MSAMSGHLTVQPGDVIEVVGSTDCGLLEGYIRGTTQTGLFPTHCVQEVQFRQKYISQVSTASTGATTAPQTAPPVSEPIAETPAEDPQPTQQAPTQFNSATAPRIKKK
jgi:SH3/ankyrin repeat-containing protein